MDTPLVTSLLELGDATSRNLEFSHQPDVLVSYGEETITETILLEIRRRHPERTVLQMFSKHQEAMNGADWEWHIVGQRRTLKMRVQAKRVQCNHVLKIKHTVGLSGNQQREILINRAQADGLKPVYCIYCTEPQRSKWKQRLEPSAAYSYQTGCLLADAHDVPLHTNRLSDIEHNSIPWHFLFEQSLYAPLVREFAAPHYDDQGHLVHSSRETRLIPVDPADEEGSYRRWNPPTIRDLNDDSGGPFDQPGVHPTTDDDRARVETGTANAEEVRRADRERLIERRIPRMLAIDVRDR